MKLPQYLKFPAAICRAVWRFICRFVEAIVLLAVVVFATVILGRTAGEQEDGL